ncbi:MAG: c-type cytochrome domain-containing protein [Verrucomicrobiota bacterium]|jgi:mono/diheme cytochrome c family protein|nr:c-type cytochrome domain-containing protein [Verrucomicrobiota bacterium]MDP7048772.1 c-type cytochrome domain-containing protein [Verrucomicrobiota bacterium]
MRKIIATTAAIGAIGLSAWAEDKVDFAKSVQGVFEARCIDCHGPKKAKGELRLDTLEATLKGGESEEPVLAPGKSGESELFKRIALKADHEDIMPPKGDPLTKEQIELIKKWIDEGANWPNGLVLVSAKDRAEAKAAAARLPEPEIKEVPVSDAEKAAIAKLASGEGIGENYAAPLVMALAQDTKLIYANFRLVGKNVKDKHIAPLADIQNLSELDLGNTQITSAGLAHISRANSLTKLSLANTATDDSGLKQIEGLSNLMSLNLYNTKVTDAGLASLKDMKFLRKVYGWQSGITDKGVAELKKALPNVDVNLGFKLAKAEPKEEKKEEKKEDSKPEKKETKPVAFNKKCPVSGKDIDPAKLFAVGFCCDNCLGDFTKDPAKHIAKVKGPDNKKCPLSDKDIDPSKQFVIGFCCGNCLGDFTKDPSKHIAKVKK